MRIDILTFTCADNYGAQLQAYALKARLRQLGYEAELVDFAPPYVAWPYWFFPYVPTRPRRNLAELRTAYRRVKLNLKYHRDFAARRHNMAAFRRERLRPRGKRLHFARQLRTLDGEALVLGSDQIWNPSCCDGLRPAYFGAYRGSCVKRVIAYAASLGSDRMPPELEARFRALIGNVDAISVREKGSVPFLRELGREAQVAVDPTLLLGEAEWAALAEPPPMDGPYIYVYLFERSEVLNDYLSELMQRTGLPVIAHRSRIARPWRPDVTQALDAGPSEFLGAIRGARYVITNSFHGTAFAAIFHRPFACIPHSTRGLRMLDLLDDLGLSDRVVRAEQNMDMDAPIHWAAVDARRAAMVRESEEFLLRELYAIRG